MTFDLCVPPVLDDQVWTYVDLELDLWVDAGTAIVHLEDEDEFSAAREAGTITSEEAQNVELAANHLPTLVARMDLVQVGGVRLLDAGREGLPPIVTLPPASHPTPTEPRLRSAGG